MKQHTLKIKVCGMREPHNIAALSKLDIDYMGFIFYPPSPRFVEKLLPSTSQSIPKKVEKVAIFVNETYETIARTILETGIQSVQLHGTESPELCLRLKKELHVTLIKAFPISKASDFNCCLPYIMCCDYFLFDTQTPQHGGSGLRFDWALLKHYTHPIPFFLSGGISLQEIHSIKQLSHPALYGVDLNSKFESAPGIKNINQLTLFIHQLTHE